MLLVSVVVLHVQRPLFVVLAPGHCPGCCGVVPCVEECGCSPCIGRYTPCGQGSGYAGVVWCLWFGMCLGRCSWCVAMGCGLVPDSPVVAVLVALRLPSPRGARLCRPPWGSGRCALGSLHGWVGVLQLCPVHRVGGAQGVCAWCSSSAPVAAAVEVVGVAPRYVTVVCAFGATLRGVQARGTPRWCRACGSVCPAAAVVGML